MKKDFLRIAAEEGSSPPPQWVPWVMVASHNGTTTIRGPMANLLRILASKLNFEYDILRPEDLVWGIPLQDGNWTGMLGMLQRQEVEMAVGPFGVTTSRLEVCDFSEPVYSENQAILTARPALTGDLSGFLQPFTLTVWLLVLIATISIGATFAFVSTKEGHLFNFKHKSSLSAASIWVIKAFTQESTEGLPRTDGSRLVVGTWLLASLVFMSCYSGILTAMLTMPRVTIPIDSLEDLVRQTELPWRLEGGSMMFHYFRDATEGVRRRVFEGRSGTFIDCWKSKREISRGDFVGICDVTAMKMLMSWDFSTTGRCHLYIAREAAYTNLLLSFAYKINSTYKHRADYWIMRAKEAGLMEVWLKWELADASQCLLPPSADAAGRAGVALDLVSFTGSLLLFLSGCGLGLLAFLLEVCLGRQRLQTRATTRLRTWNTHATPGPISHLREQ